MIKRSLMRSGASVRLIFQTGGLFQKQFFDSFSTRASDSNREPRQFDFGASLRQIAKSVENKAADGVDSVRFQFKTEMLSQIVQTCVTADEKFSVFERLDVNIDISA